MATTAKEIAQRVGLSRQSVSRIMSNATGYSYSQETRERVLKAASEMNYRPNAVARSLRTQRTNIIGLYSGYGLIDASYPFVGKVLNGLQEECNIHHKDLLLHTGFGVHTAESTYDLLVNGKIDGLVLFSPPSDRLVELLASSLLPAIVIADSVPNLPSVVVDDVGGARLLADLLAAGGHRRILYRMPLREAAPSPSVRRRFEAFVGFAAVYGMSVTQTREENWDGELSDEERVLLSARAGERPTAAICFHDSSAYGLVVGAGVMGLRVPEDLAVAGFNGFKSEASRFCKLTTIRANWSDVGRTAISLLVDLMEGKEIPPETVFPVELVVGDTT